eukprot:3570585-Lingulodinium_polyedra.AAC.1
MGRLLEGPGRSGPAGPGRPGQHGRFAADFDAGPSTCHRGGGPAADGQVPDDHLADWPIIPGHRLAIAADFNGVTW